MEPGRKHPAHPPVLDAFNVSIIIFLTVCSKDRKPIFASLDAAEAIINSWHTAKSWHVGRYVIMPNHIHLFCAPATSPSEPLKQWVRYWKNTASRNWPRREEHPVWQRDFWDTQLRRSENYESKWIYVMDNPVRAKLAESADDWLFQGELHSLAW
jgi:REP element-mobilizing transposase RayT